MIAAGAARFSASLRLSKMAAQALHTSASPHAPFLVTVFDLDGTITQPHAINFGEMRRRIECPPGTDILAHCEAQAEPLRSELLAIVAEEEELGLERMTLRPEAADLFRHLTEKNFMRGLLTRNNSSAMHRTVQLLRSSMSLTEEDTIFHLMLSREFLPCKPHPAPLHHFGKVWQRQMHHVVMVGDSVDDAACAKAAGAHAVLIGEEGDKVYEGAKHLADYKIRTLTELPAVLEQIAEKLAKEEGEAAGSPTQGEIEATVAAAACLAASVMEGAAAEGAAAGAAAGQ